jgi:hypothetical protein
VEPFVHAGEPVHGSRAGRERDGRYQTAEVTRAGYLLRRAIQVALKRWARDFVTLGVHASRAAVEVDLKPGWSLRAGLTPHEQQHNYSE